MVVVVVVALVVILGPMLAQQRGRNVASQTRVTVKSSRMSDGAGKTTSSGNADAAASSTQPRVGRATDATSSQDTYQYAVGVGDFEDTTYRGYGVDEPASITINAAQGASYNHILTIVYPQDSPDPPMVTKVGAEIQQGPTTEFRLFSGHGNDEEIRTVKANTQVNVVTAIATDNGPADDGARYVGERFYLFYNVHGTLSLATPNFAGNVTEDQFDVKAEYVQE
ncbi:hypothetical protein FD19_GL000938 [Lacticaseibacillus thailandensis DSM 22698 = JCM 13996]|uniref:Lipoprotein n=1 Tax=Lacticaseibacillus thailandensis DSM 22698 = JCM 13996 TaxID=1423810 RepID=A0A0R2C7S9_9LACO|nr:hypothetical protein FD19_GL000938 [Lacticaseibacillus thailandensis DSM 22698 = JCM 13996]